MFGHQFTAEDSIIASLESQGIRRLYSAKDVDRKKELRKLKPGLRVPCSTRPVMTSPTPLILYTPETGIRSGFLFGRFGTWTTSFKAFKRVFPETSFFFGLTVNPLYQSMLVDSSIRLSPLKPDIGTNGIFFVLNPIFVSIFFTSLLISLKRSSLYGFGLVESILLTPTMTCSTPRRCSRR